MAAERARVCVNVYIYIYTHLSVCVCARAGLCAAGGRRGRRSGRGERMASKKTKKPMGGISNTYSNSISSSNIILRTKQNSNLETQAPHKGKNKRKRLEQ